MGNTDTDKLMHAGFKVVWLLIYTEVTEIIEFYLYDDAAQICAPSDGAVKSSWAVLNPCLLWFI